MPCNDFDRSILDSLSEGVFTVDKDWKISSFNRSAEEITGISCQDALGQICSDVLHSTLCERRCPIREALAKGSPIKDQRCYFVDIEGERIPISVSAATLIDNAGHIIGGVETFRDISELEALRNALHRQNSLTSQSPLMQQVFDLVPVLAGNPTSVLIYGETGTGKEIIARAIHQQGPRADKPFIAINCGALPENLLESELFGYKKGAFTGADRDKPGRLAQARDGTLFLDEIGEISSAMQIRLLRVLQEREFEPLSSTKPEPFKARVIAASHRDLKQMVDEGRFRQDLYYRLVVFRLDIPPLRQRREDIPALAAQLLARANARMERNIAGIDPDAMAALQHYDWPGNIRQLENVIERAVVLCHDAWIAPEQLPSELKTFQEASDRPPPPAAQIRRQAEAEAILSALKENGFNRKATAAQLGMHPTTLYRKIKAWELLQSVPTSAPQY